MSSYLAIATVTATLRDILQDAAAEAVPGAIVTTKHPTQNSNDGQEKAGINMYLYQATPNADWANFDLPTRDFTGRLLNRPQVALNLDYILSFHGSEMEMEPQRLLGKTVLRLHRQPVLSADVIHTTINNTTFLAQSDLFEQIEPVRITPLNLTLEELSKLWSIFFQIPYILSTAYRASVVLIDDNEVITEPKPVLQRSILVKPEVPNP